MSLSDQEREHGVVMTVPPVPFAEPSHRRFGMDVARGAPWRSRDDRVLTGLAGGIAEWLGVSSVIVRPVVAFLVVLTGIGPLLYVMASAVLPVASRAVPAHERLVRLPQGPSLRRAGIALGVALAATVLLQAVGTWLGGDLGVPAALAATGVALLWSRTDVERREFWRSRLVRLPGDPVAHAADHVTIPMPSARRILLGALLLTAGTTWVLGATDPDALVPVLAGVGFTVGGVALVAGPWMATLWRDLSDERRARIRTEERAEVAAQLHDSVLQTLALIQRHPETTRAVAQLARQQERSLRTWLFEAEASGSFADQLRSAAHQVEDRSGVPVELVVVGDLPTDVRTEALTAATREAMANAAAHSGAAAISVFAEITDDATTVFVRDRGAGFELPDVPADRRGVRESIVARMDRHGGRATVSSTPGEGTEVALELPR